MFAIEQAVENWKNDLRQKQTLLETDIEELELHLREEMERLTPLGLSEEEAFIVAARRIGDTTQMASEFAKVNTAVIWKNRFFWMIAGVLVSRFIFDLSFFVSRLSIFTETYFHWFGWYGAGIFSSILYGLSLIVSLLIFYFSVTRISFGRRISKYNTITTILATWLFFTIGGQLLKTFPMIFMARICPVEQIRQLSIGMQYSVIVVNAIWAIILISLFILLRPKKAQTA